MSKTILVFQEADVNLSAEHPIKGYREPSGRFRIGLDGASLALGFEKDWLATQIKENSQIVQELAEHEVYLEVVEGKVIAGETTKIVSTISLDDFNVLLAYCMTLNPVAYKLGFELRQEGLKTLLSLLGATENDNN